MANNDSNPLIKLGPVGSSYGPEWDHKGRNDIVQIIISHSAIINSIRFQYADNRASERIGSDIGHNFSAVKLNYPHEYITSISGDRFHDNGPITSIKFRTNRGEYGPFVGLGRERFNFSFSLGDGQFGGFHGTADSSGLNSIGVYVKSIVTDRSS